MPYGRRASRKVYRRRFFRGRKTYGTKSYMGRKVYKKKYRQTRVKIPTRIMPDYTLVRMKDSITYLTTTGTSAGANYSSRINFTISGSDIYAPFDLLGTPYDKYQPTGFSQWMAFYNNFLVHKSSIRITPIYWHHTGAAGTTAAQPFQITITPVTVDTLTASSQVEFDEQPYAKYKIYNGILLETGSGATGNPVSTGSQTPPYVYNSMMTKKMLGYKDLSDVPAVKGTSTTSPGTQFYWNVEIRSMVPNFAPNASNTLPLPQLGVRIDIYYKVQLSDRNAIPDLDEEP